MKIEINQKNTTFEQLFDNFIMSCKAKGLAEKTILSYQSHFKCIGKYINVSQPIDSIQRNDIESMVSQMRDKGLASNTIKSYLRVLSAFSSWCTQCGYPPLFIPKFKVEESIKTPYTDEELRLLIRKPNLQKCAFEEYRNWVIINLLLDCGCRAATIRAIEVGDVDFSEGSIAFRHTKNKKVQVLPMSSTMSLVLKEYLRIRKGSPEDKLFCTVEGQPLSENALKKGIRKYNLSRGVSKTSIHLFRHTFCRKYLLDCNGDAFTLQHILGHSTLAMTKHYCNLYSSDLLKNYDDCSPLVLMSQKKRIKMK